MKLKGTITQGMLERMEELVIEHKDAITGGVKQRGEHLRWAVEAGWFDDPQDVSELDARLVAELSEQVARLYIDLLSVSPQLDGGGKSRPNQDDPAAA